MTVAVNSKLSISTNMVKINDDVQPQTRYVFLERNALFFFKEELMPK